MGTKVFWAEPSPHARESLRRYGAKCSGKYGYHDAEVVLGEKVVLKGETCRDSVNVDKTDPRWPKRCEHCDYEFTDQDSWQHNLVRLYEGDGKKFVLQEAPVGAMWDATWYPESFGKGPDGIALVVKTPGGEWHVDGRASNCTRREDDKHRCWVRHGSPKVGVIHVDKNGDTCSAGAGSIVCGSYHGFLHNGELT